MKYHNYYKNDPNSQRESELYKEPVPSREYIKQVIEQANEDLKTKDLINTIGVLLQHQEGFKNRLKAMLRDGEIIQTKQKYYRIANQLPMVKGKVSAHPDGYGFIHSPEIADKLFCPAREMQKVMHGDDVLVRIVSQSRSGRAEVIIDKVIQHNTQSVVGKLYTEGQTTFVRSMNKKQSDIVVINPPKKALSDYVCIDITHQPTLKSPPMGKISEVINPNKCRHVDVLLAIKSYQLPHQWTKAQHKWIKKFHKRIYREECEREIKQGRKDLRHLPFITIDGKEAKDFDDAVYCQFVEGGGWRLMVAIADVSYYVKPDDPLDQEAQRRGNSVYFPGQVIPMLPEQLSNGLCSLNPHVTRFAMCCEMEVNPQGEVTDYCFYPCIIKSSVRFTYKQINNLLKSKNHPNWQNYSHKVHQSCLQLRALYKAQKKARLKRGAIEVESDSLEFSISSKGKIKKIKKQKLKLAHRIIEECMLMANVSAAHYLEKHDKAFLYRIHDQPKIQKIQALRELLDDLNIHFDRDEIPPTSAFTRALYIAKKTPYHNIVQTAVLRSFKKALYSLENKGHFGLNYRVYTHFTSPIRRYPDIIVHRAIKEVISQERCADKESKKAQLRYLADHVSFTERRADEATREVTERLKCEYASHHINEVFEGTISSVTHFGLFVDLDNIYTEGLLHISALGSDYFIYDEIYHCLCGEKTKKRYEVGMRLRVRLTRVSIEDIRIYLDLA